MTRHDEQIARAIAKAHEQKRAAEQRLKAALAQREAQARKAREKRRYLVGKLLDDAGLFVWSDVSLQRVVALLAPLAPLAHPDLILGRVLVRVPLEQLRQEAAAVHAEVEALIATKATLVLVGDNGTPLTRRVSDDDNRLGEQTREGA